MRHNYIYLFVRLNRKLKWIKTLSPAKFMGDTPFDKWYRTSRFQVNLKKKYRDFESHSIDIIRSFRFWSGRCTMGKRFSKNYIVLEHTLYHMHMLQGDSFQGSTFILPQVPVHWGKEQRTHKLHRNFLSFCTAVCMILYESSTLG